MECPLVVGALRARGCHSHHLPSFFPDKPPTPPCPCRACRAPSLQLLRTALTSKSALESSDYERLETLGDGFIKFAVRAL